MDTNVLATGAFWKATLERVLSTFLQTYFGLYLAGATLSTFDVFNFPWYAGLGPALGAALLSLVKALLVGNLGNKGPSLANETLTDYPNPGAIR